MIENLGLFVLGAMWGGAVTAEVLFKRVLRQRDVLGDALREQTRKVAFLSRFADAGYEARSEAKVTTIDGDFEVHVIRRTR